MSIILTYNNLEGRNTKDVLRRLTTSSMDKLREETDLMWKIMESRECKEDPEYSEIWNKPTQAVPKKTVIPNKKYTLQSPREYLEGFMEKINRSRGTDLSPKQMDGFYNLHSWFVQEFEFEEILFCDQDVLFKDPALYNTIKNLHTIL